MSGDHYQNGKTHSESEKVLSEFPNGDLSSLNETSGKRDVIDLGGSANEKAPVFKPRTTSLHTNKTSQKVGGLFAGLFAALPTLSPYESEDEQNETYEFRISKNHAMKFISQQDTLLNELDDASHRMTLEALESENAKLLLNPKTILASAGSYRTTTSTLHELTMDTNIYDGDNDDSDFWNSIMTDYTSLVHKIPQLLIKKIRGGIPSGLRPKIWMIMCDAQPERMKLLYPNLLKEESQFERIIKRDLPRTFPKVEMFKDPEGDGQKQLYNLLKAYSIYDSDVGYCQGLSFVAGPLLMQNMSEVDAFSILVKLMEESPIKSKKAADRKPYALRSLFTTQMVGLHLMLFQHGALVKKLLPNLHDHFQKFNINASMFLTLFAYNFPFPIVFRIFDIIFAEGALVTILRFSISMLRKNEPQLLKKAEFEDILNYLKGDSLFLVYKSDAEMAVKDAMNESAVITDSILESLKRDTAEIQAMRLLVGRLRNDSFKMLSNLNELTERNNMLEKEYSDYQVFKKGAQIEIETLRTELLSCKNSLDVMAREKETLLKQIEELKLSGDLAMS